MSNQIVISSGAKVRSLEGVLTGTAGIVNSVPLGGANGVATLDSMGKVPLSQLPASVVTYLGTWNAATNTPTLTNGVGDVGDLYICNVAGTVNFGAGPITFAVGDWVIYSGTEWQKSSGASGTVTSVAVTESGDALTITGSPITTSGTINIGFAGTGSQYIKGDGTLATFPTTIDQAKRLITEVYNSTGATLSKGTVVYINGGQGNLPTVTKAQANADNTSAQTYGVVQSDITNMNNGFVVVFGSLTDLDTQAYAVGTQLYLSGTTAGAWTSTKPSAPIHLVYVGIVVRSHPTQGVVEIRIQNGYELEELHDVAISAPVNNQGIFYNSSNDLWENKSIATALGYTPANDALVVHLAGTENITGQKTFNATLFGTDAEFSGSILSPIVAILDNTTYTKVVRLQTTAATNRDVYFPDLNGTVTLLEGTQTFSGVKNFDIGLTLRDGYYPTPANGYIGLASNGSGLTILTKPSATVYNHNLQFQASSNDYNFPAITGVMAMLEGTQTFSGAKTFSTFPTTFDAESIFNLGFQIKKITTGVSASAGYMAMYSPVGTANKIAFLDGDSTRVSTLTFDTTGSFSYTFPASSGTLALTSNLSSYVPYTGATTNVDLGSNFLKARTFYSEGSGGGGSYAIKNGTTPSFEDGYTILSSNDYRLNIVSTVSAATKAVYFGFSGVTATRTYTLPDASGTLALTSNLSSYVPYTGATADVNLGNTYSLSANNITSAGVLKSDFGLQLKSGLTTTVSGYLSISAQKISTNSQLNIYTDTGFYFSLIAPNTANYSYTFPASNGTIVLGSGTTNYLPKFTGASTIGNSQIQDDGTSVGIGGSPNASYKLAVTGNTLGTGTAFDFFTSSGIGSSGVTGLLRVVTAGTSTGIAIGQANSSRYTAIQPNEHIIYNDDFFMRTNGAFPLSLGTNNTIRMSITSGGVTGFSVTPASQNSGAYAGSAEFGGIIRIQGSGGRYFTSGNGLEMSYNSIYSYNRGTNAYNDLSINDSITVKGAGNVGIGTSSPSTPLYVVGSMKSETGLYFNNATTNGAFVWQEANTPLRFATNDTERMRIFASGNVRFSSQVYGNTVASPRTLYIASDGELGGISSIRASKTNINQIDSNWLMQLNPVSFNYRKKDEEGNYTEEHYNELFYGLIAEETELVNKEICTYNEDKLVGIEYSKLVPVLIKAIQELSAKVTALENK